MSGDEEQPESTETGCVHIMGELVGYCFFFLTHIVRKFNCEIFSVLEDCEISFSLELFYYHHFLNVSVLLLSEENISTDMKYLETPNSIYTFRDVNKKKINVR